MESFDQVKELLEIREDIDKAFIIGGAQIFNYAMENGLCDVLLLTKIISPEFNCDTYCSYLAEENIKNHFFEAIKSDIITEDEINYQIIAFVKDQETDYQSVLPPHIVEKYFHA